MHNTIHPLSRDALQSPKYFTVSSILFPHRCPSRSQIRSAITSVEGALVDAQHTNAYTRASAGGVLRPDAEANGVGATVVDDAWEDREGNLIADVWDKFAKLPSSQ